MTYILLTILFITIIGIVFKVFPKYEINAFQAIVVNYAVCVILSWLHGGEFPIGSASFSSPWFKYAFGLSFCFIIGFYLQSVIYKVFGIAVSSIVLKLSLVLTAVFSIMMYAEALPTSKIIGLFLAVVAIILVSYPQKGSLFENGNIETKHWLILIISYLIAAAVDIGFIYIERSVNSETADPRFIGTATGLAFTWGMGRELYRVGKGSSAFELKNLIAGILLGIVNYLTFWGMMMSISTGIDASIVFTIMNIGVILAAALLGILFFKERLVNINIAGVVIALVAVCLIANVL